MSGGSSPPPPPYIPPPPPREEMPDIIDEIAGVKTITVKGADGRNNRVIRRIPRSPEAQKIYDEAGTLMDRTLEEIKKLSTYDPTAVVDFSGLINTLGDLDTQRKADIAELSKIPDFNKYVDELKANNNAILEKEFTRQENQSKSRLVAKGYGDSTAMEEMRAAIGKNRAEALVQSDLNANAQGQELMARDLGNRTAMYDFREKQRADQLRKADSEYQLALSQKDQLDNARQQMLQNQYGLFQTGAKIRGDDDAKAMASRAPELGNQIFQMNNADSLNRYQAGVGAQQANYQNQLQAYNSRGASFGDSIMKLGMSGLGAFGGSYLGTKGFAMAGGNLNNAAFKMPGIG